MKDEIKYSNLSGITYELQQEPTYLLNGGDKEFIYGRVKTSIVPSVLVVSYDIT